MDTIESNVLDIIFNYSRKDELLQYVNVEEYKAVIYRLAIILTDFVTLRDRFILKKFNSLHQLFRILHELYHHGHGFSENIYLFIVNYIDQLLIRKKKNIKPNYIRQNNNFICSLSCTNKKIRQTLAGWNSIMKQLYYSKCYRNIIKNELDILSENYTYNFDKIKFIMNLSDEEHPYVYPSDFMKDLYDILKKHLTNSQIKSLVNKQCMFVMKESYLYFTSNDINDICRNKQYSKLLSYTFFSIRMLNVTNLLNCDDESSLNHILNHSHDLNSYGIYLIHNASEFGHLKLVKLLHQRGIDLDAENRDKYRPIHLACKNNHLSVIQYLINSNVDINAVNYKNEKPIHIACRYNYLNIVELIASHYPEQLEEPDGFQRRPIHIACIYKHIYLILFLLEKVNLESEDSNGFRPIYYACKNYSKRIGSVICSNPHLDLCTVKLLVCGSIAYAYDLIKIPSKVNLNCFNNKCQKPIDLIDDENIRDFILQKMKYDNRTIFSDKKIFYCDITIKKID